MVEAVGFVRDIGFPIFVAVFVLVRLEKTLKRIADVNAGILTIISDCETRKRKALGLNDGQ